MLALAALALPALGWLLISPSFDTHPSAVQADPNADHIVDIAVGAPMLDVPLDEPVGPFSISLGTIAITESTSASVSMPPATPAPGDASVASTAQRPNVRAERPADLESAAPEPRETCRSFVLTGPTFATNRAELTTSGIEMVRRLVAELQRGGCGYDHQRRSCPVEMLGVMLDGHTDERPTSREGGNHRLSLDRARAVADLFRSAGFRILSVDGYAHTRPAPAPIPDRRSVAERQRDDRRVEIHLVCMSAGL